MVEVARPAIERSRWRRLHALVTDRGWELGRPWADHTVDDDLPPDPETTWEYRAAFGGVEFAGVDGASPEHPSVRFFYAATRPAGILVGGAGYRSGCPEHRCARHTADLDDPGELLGVLARVERASRDLDALDLVRCRFFGRCFRAHESR